MVSRFHVCCGQGQWPSCCHGAFQGMDASNTMLLDMAKGCWADGHHAEGLWDASFPHLGGLVAPLPCQSHSCSSQLGHVTLSLASPCPLHLSQALGLRCHFICLSASDGTRRVQTCCWPSLEQMLDSLACSPMGRTATISRPALPQTFHSPSCAAISGRADPDRKSVV